MGMGKLNEFKSKYSDFLCSAVSYLKLRKTVYFCEANRFDLALAIEFIEYIARNYLSGFRATDRWQTININNVGPRIISLQIYKQAFPLFIYRVISGRFFLTILVIFSKSS